MSDKHKRSYPLDGFISNKKPRHDLLTSNESDSGSESEGSKHNEIESDKEKDDDEEDEEMVFHDRWDSD
jgi:hypothetical protein